MECRRIRLTDLEINRGQVEGLPSNPREWTRTDLDHLIKSIKETPELLEARGLIVYPHGGKYIILGGNMRFSALREMNEVDAPCYVMPEDTPIEKLREIIIKDNGAFGSWDYDMLANEWDDLPLTDWGVPAWETKDVSDLLSQVNENDFSDDFEVPNVEKSPFRTISFNVTEEENELLYLAIDISNYTEGNLQETEDENTNTKGLMFIVREWLKKDASDLDIEEGRSAEDIEEELRIYLRTALKNSGKTQTEVDQHLGTVGMSGHYFGASQWMFPTYDAYRKMREIMDLPRDYMECYRLWAKSKKNKTLRKLWEKLKILKSK